MLNSNDLEKVTRSGIGRGYTEQEALSDWLQNDPELNAQGLNYGHEALNREDPIIFQELKKPRRAKRVKTEMYPQKGSRKFVTAYKVQDVLDGSTIEFASDTEGLLNVVGTIKVTHFSRQMAAIAAAKEHSRSTHRTYEIIIEKVLTEGHRTVATVSPGKSSQGEYKFSASFKY